MQLAGAMSTLNNLMAQRLVGEHSRNIGAIMERLSTGERINRAKDDPSGVIVSAMLDAEMMRARGEIESNDALLHRLAVTEGYASVLAELASDLEGTVTMAAGGDALSEDEREALQLEADSIIKAMANVYDTAIFKGEKLLGTGFDLSTGGTYRRVELQGFDSLGSTWLGYPPPDPTQPADPDPTTDPGPDNPTTDPRAPEAPPPEASPWGTITDLMSGGRLNLIDGDLEKAMAVATASRKSLVEQWAGLGRDMRQIESRNSLLAQMLEGNRAASSQLTDADFAVETSALVREQVLQQASIFVLNRSHDMQKRALGLFMGS